tara:strand:+ start:1749 stop:3800 length:2052 start_codon:yes stop_codon:yes gene_type:complete
MSKKTNVQTFHKSLKDNGYLCTESFADSIYCALRKKPMSITMLIGQAGTGKSFLPETLGDVLKCNVYVKQAYQGMDWDEFVRKHVPDENTKSGIKSIDAELLRAVQESKDKQVILLLDEWDKTRISSDSYFLDFLQTGRISVSGKKYQANLDNLIIFFTSNNERDISEPLLRRVKVIEVEHLPVKLVADVLKKKYKDSPNANGLIEPILKLYDTSVRSSMDKPATIQELCDLINDWLTYLEQGKQPDWKELVYINITKNERNHIELQNQIVKDVEGVTTKSDTFDKSLDSTHFDNPVTIDESGDVKVGFMPKMMKLRSFDVDFEPMNDNKNDVYADIERDEESYTSAFIETMDSGVSIDVPHFIGWNSITNNRIQRSKPYQLSQIVNEYDKFKRMRKSDGVLVFIEEFADKDDVLNFIETSDSVIRKGTDDEIIFRWYTGRLQSNVRWKKNKGCEFIVPTQMIDSLRELVHEVCWYEPREYSPISHIHSHILSGAIHTDYYIMLRRLGSTKNYLDITVKGLGKSSDDISEHRDLVTSGEAKVKETSRTTTYDLGYALIRSWHKKGNPNYRTDITIKDMPTNGNGNSSGMMLISRMLSIESCNTPLFVSVNKGHFLKCDLTKWKTTKSSRVLVNESNDSYKTYAINCFDRTTFMIESKKPSDLSDMFMFADQLRSIRDTTLEVI